MDDLFQETFDSAVETGEANLKILKLAAAWCKNISWTKGPMGTGLIEQTTGLPVSGGSLRCDFAQAPTAFAMALENTAIGFYEENCLGCPNREATEADGHLGSWADSLIEERDRGLREAQEVRQAAIEAHRRRQADRRLMLGAPDTTVQSLLDLIDRVDGDEPDHDAENLLEKHAEMSPDDFPVDLVEHLADEALGIGNTAILNVVFAIFERRGIPAAARTVGVAFEAVGQGLAPVAASRVIAAFADSFDVSDESLAGLVRVAAGERSGVGGHYRINAAPAALLRFYDVDPKRTVGLISTLLGDGRPSVRVVAAHASEKLVDARPAAAQLLIPALLDSLSYPDNSRYLGDPFVAAQTQKIVGGMLAASPRQTASAIDRCLEEATDPAHLDQLWRCYDRAIRDRLRDSLGSDLPTVVVSRAGRFLQQDLDIDLLGGIADTLELTCSYHGGAVDLGTTGIVELAHMWADRLGRVDESRPAEGDMLTLSDSYFDWQKTNAILRKVTSALSSIAKYQPDSYIGLLTGGEWDGSETSGKRRVALLRALGPAILDEDKLSTVLPFFVEALEDNRQAVRAAGLGVLADLRQNNLRVPAELVEMIVAALHDEFLIVVCGAIHAVASVEPAPEVRPDIVTTLLQFAHCYGPERIHSQDVHLALAQSLRLSRGQQFEESARGLVLDLIRGFPSGESAELLRRLRIDDHETWPAAAAHALQVDPDPNYYRLHDGERRVLLRELAELETDRLRPHFDELEAAARDRLDEDPAWAWAVADVLAMHDEHLRAGRLCDSVVDSKPDTVEQRPFRRFARQVAIYHQLDAFASTGDIERFDELITELEGLPENEAT